MRARRDAGRRGHGDETRYGDGYYEDEYYADSYYDPAYYEPADDRNARRAGFFVRAGRVVSGVVCAAVVVLAVVMGGAQYLAGQRDFAGPGVAAVVAHGAAALIAVVAQVVADRRRGPVSLLAAGVVIFTASILMFTQWWS